MAATSPPQIFRRNRPRRTTPTLARRIELLKQGFLQGGSLYVYDIASAYPAAMVDFPSLADGMWIERSSAAEIATGSLSELRAAIEAASVVSMFKIRFQFPTYERFDADARKAVFIPFYPLPYRDKRGGILFPASGYGWYMRDDVLAAIAWLGTLRTRLLAATERSISE